jgi:hypothetical protein
VADEASKLRAENATLRQAAENLVGDIAQLNPKTNPALELMPELMIIRSLLKKSEP